MNELLARAEFHSVAARSEAEREFADCPEIIEIFYGDLDPSPTSHRALREKLLPLPPVSVEGAARTLILGNSGVGKTTLLRRLIGSNPVTERFPATSANRTTTCEIEIITGQADFSAAVTFLTRHQSQQEVTVSLSNAVLKAIEGAPDEAVMIELLEQSDQRFRLKYVLGGWTNPAARPTGSFSFNASTPSHIAQTDTSQKFLKAALTAIRKIADAARREVEEILGPLATLKDDERSYALDEMQRAAEQTDDFLELVNEVMEEIEARFSQVSEYAGGGKFSKSSTGWPYAWMLSSPSGERTKFLNAVRWFCSNVKEEWGKLLTPLVTGMRVGGSFRPDWVPPGEDYSHVFIDTQGLDHEKPATELSMETTSLFREVQNILFVESGKDSLKSHSARKVMEAIAGAGYTTNLTVLLSHMDLVTGDDIPTDEDRRTKAFSGLRSLIDNEVSRNVSRESAKQLAAHLEQNTFFLGYLTPKSYPDDWDEHTKLGFEAMIGGELWEFTNHLTAKAIPQKLQPVMPQYSFESLGLAVQEASIAFQEIWAARLGYKRVEGISIAPWQSVKAMTRRYAEGWFDGYWLRPVDTLVTQTRNVLTRFIEGPLAWQPEHKKVSDGEIAAIIDRLKQLVNDELTEISKTRLWKVPQPKWQGAHEPFGPGSTFTRKQRVRDILVLQVPVPQSISDRWAQAWVEEIKSLLKRALERLKAEQDDKRRGDGKG
jgi:GTPase Era involved in 16S rRNA processing